MANKKNKKKSKVVKKSAKKTSKKITKKLSKKIQKKATKKVVKKNTKKTPLTTAVSKTPVVKVDYSKAITPLGDRLVVKISSQEKMTAGGLYIPDTASTAVGYLKAKVLAVGHGAKNKKGQLKPLDVKVGDMVLFSQHAGTKVTFHSEELQIIHESDVMGILQN